MGLVPALRSLLSRFEDSLEIDLVIDAEVFALDAQGEAYLPEKQRLGVYRIAEEALNNALKHAQATQVEVSLICQGGHQLVLSVRDNGRGFDPSQVSHSHGVMLMGDYAEAMGGKTTITSTPGQGTTVTLVLPLPEPAQPVAAEVNLN
jgi:signal transduction histidine kinase